MCGGEWNRSGQATGEVLRDIAAVGSLNRPDFGRSARDQMRGKGTAIYRLVWIMDHHEKGTSEMDGPEVSGEEVVAP